MIDTQRQYELMEHAIAIASQSQAEDGNLHPLVGAVLANPRGEVIATGFRGELGPGDHAEYCLLKKVEQMEVDISATTLFVTLEPCTFRNPPKEPCAHRIVKAGISEVFIGMLDPDANIATLGQFHLRDHDIRVEFFPHSLTSKIIRDNFAWLAEKRNARLPPESLYSKLRIHTAIRSQLSKDGWDIDELPHGWDVSFGDLVGFCSAFADQERMPDVVRSIERSRGKAFDQKYADYDYSQDTRGLINNGWQSRIREQLQDLHSDYTKSKVLVVGIGNGLEAEGLYTDIQDLTIVDIGEESIQKAKQLLPKAKAIVSSAENLQSSITNGSIDVYISLRTYQSSYFGIPEAIREAHRVLRHNGSILISVSNGFLGSHGEIIKGLVRPESTIVDLERPYDVATLIRKQLRNLRFVDVRQNEGADEIYISARKI